MKVCSACGMSNPDEGSYCIRCGQSLWTGDQSAGQSSGGDQTRIVPGLSASAPPPPPMPGASSVVSPPPAPQKPGGGRTHVYVAIAVGAVLALMLGGVGAWLLASTKSGEAAGPTASPSPVPQRTVTVTPTSSPSIPTASSAPTVEVTATVTTTSTAVVTDIGSSLVYRYLGYVSNGRADLACQMATSAFAPCQPSEYGKFVAGTQSTQISNINVVSQSGNSYLVKYTSNQSPQDAPDNTGLTCTTWTVRFDFVDEGQGLKIVKIANPNYPSPAYSGC